MTETKQKTGLHIIVCSLFAIGCFGMAAYFAYDATILVQRGKSVMATCTKIETKTTGSGSKQRTRHTYHVSYEAEGQGTQLGTVDASFAGLREGDKIEVLYDPLQPDRVQSNRFISLWGWVMLCGFGGLIFMYSLFKRQRPTLTRPPEKFRSEPEDHQTAVAQLVKRWKRIGILFLAALLLIGGGLWAWESYAGTHTLPVTAVAVSSDGSRILSAAGDDGQAEIILWDTQQKKKLLRMSLGGGEANWVQFVGDSASLAVLSCRIEGNSYDDFRPNQIVVVDLNQQHVLAEMTEANWDGDTLVLHDTERLVSHSDNGVQLRDLQGKEIASLLSAGNLRLQNATFSADENRLAVSGNDQVYIWDLTTLAPLDSLVAKGTDFDKLALNHNGDWVATSRVVPPYGMSAEQTEFPLYLWHREHGDGQVKTVQLEHPVTHLAYVPGRPERLLVASGRDHRGARIELYSLAGERLHELYSGTAAIDWWDVSKDGSRLLFSKKYGGDGVELWDLSTNEPEQIWKKQPFRLRKAILSPDAETLIGYREPSAVGVVNAADGSPVFEVQGSRQLKLIETFGWIAAGLIFLVAVTWGTIAVSHRGDQRRKQLMDSVAERLGWHHDTGESTSGLPEFDFFKSRPGLHFEHMMTGQSLESPSRLCVASWVVRTNDSTQTVREWCVIYDKVSDEFPNLYIYPETIASRIVAMAGWQDIDIDHTQSLQQFSNKYVLRSPVPERMPDVITDELADHLCQHLGWSIEIIDGSMLLRWQQMESFRFQRSRMRDVSSVLAFREEAESIADFFLQPK